MKNLKGSTVVIIEHHYNRDSIYEHAVVTSHRGEHIYANGIKFLINRGSNPLFASEVDYTGTASLLFLSLEDYNSYNRNNELTDEINALARELTLGGKARALSHDAKVELLKALKIALG